MVVGSADRRRPDFTVHLERRTHSKNPLVPLEDILYWGASGSLNDTIAECSKFSRVKAVPHQGAYSKMWHDLLECTEGVHIGPTPWEDIFDDVDMSSGVGRPWKFLFPSKQHMVDAFGGEAEFLQAMREFEEAISAGECLPDLNWAVFSKTDKYKLAKLTSARLRTIQGGSIVHLLLLKRWIKNLVHAVYANHPRIFMVRTNFSFVQRVVRDLRDRWTVGFDATGYDRNVPGDFILALLQDCLRLTGCPENVALLLVHSTVYGDLVLPDGSIIDRSGGNPSGVFVTGFINSCYMDYIKHSVYEEMGISDVQWLITGDDSLDAYAHPGVDVKAVAQAMASFTGMEIKVDLMDGQLYPPGTHAPYLSTVSYIHDGFVVTLPSEARRTLGWWHTQPATCTPDKLYASCSGINASLGCFRALEALSGLRNVYVEQFFQHFEAMVMRRRELGQVADIPSWESSAYVHMLPLEAPDLPMEDPPLGESTDSL